MSNAKLSKMLSLCLITLSFVIVRGQIDLPVDLNTHVYPQNIRPKREANCKLPGDTITPINYKLELYPNYSEYNGETMALEAEVHIEFLLEKSVPSLQLNARHLKLHPNNFYLMTFEETVRGFTIEPDSECDFVHISKSDYIFERGLYMFKIIYGGSIKDYSFDLDSGLFKGFYTNDKNESKMFIGTHFDPSLARTVFPCFDEPKYKATFQLIIYHIEKYKVISSMPILKQTLDKTEFMRTPLISPNLLSFVICDFKNISNSDNLAVYVRPDIVKYANFSLDIATLIFKAFEDYFDLRPKEMFDSFVYKLDLVGLPKLLGPEHSLGLITFNENNLIYNEQNSPSTAVLQAYVESIAEEIVQQWFENFVSITDWKYAWINDGTKIFLAHYIVDKIINNWHSMDQFIVDDILYRALEHDVEKDVPLENNVSPFFLSDQKGPAIILMMQHFLTESVFRSGLQLYLRKNKKNPVDSNDFLNALQDAALEANININIKAVMKGWLEYPGYPVLNVTINHDNNQMKITQKRFRSEDLSKEEKNVTNLWHIPINYATAANPDFHITTPNQWIKDDETTIFIQVKKEDWLILNKQVSGYYRINYSKDNWNLLIDYLKSANRGKIHVLNRAQLLNDAVAFVKQNTLDLEIFLSLTTYVKNETDYIAWLAAFKAFQWLDNKLFNSEFYPAFKNFSVKSIQNWIKLVGYEEKANDEHIIKISREEALKHACKYGDSSCLKMMEEKLKKWFNATNNAEKKKIIPPDYVGRIICWGLQNASFDLWNKSFTLLLNTKDMREKLNLIQDLGCSRNKTTLKYYLNFTFRDNSPLLEHTENVIYSIYSENDVAFDVIFEFVMENYNIFVEKIGRQQFVSEIFSHLAARITTETNLKRLKATKLHIPQNVMDDAIRVAKKNIDWLTENKEKLETWLNGVKSYSASILLTLISLFMTLVFTFNI